MNIDGNFPTYEQQQQAITLLQSLGVDMDTLLAGRVVKSVQRGKALGQTGKTTHDIIINAVDISKSIILSTYKTPSGTNGAFETMSELVNSTTIRLSSGLGNTGLEATWQVIEFY